MALLDFLELTPTLLEGAFGAIQRSRGYDMQAKAYEGSAASYRQAARQGQALAEYNIELDKQALARDLDVTSRQLRRLMSTQRSQFVGTGASISSKSFLAVANASLDTVQRQVLDAKNAQRILARQRRYSAAQQAVDLENQARASEYQAELSMFRQKKDNADAITSGITTILGSFF